MDSTKSQPSGDPYNDYHMSLCIQERVEEMTDPQKCMRYMAGHLYEQSKTDSSVNNITMQNLHDYCTGPNMQTNMEFFVDLCRGTNAAYMSAFQKKK